MATKDCWFVKSLNEDARWDKFWSFSFICVMTWFKDVWFIINYYLKRFHWLSLDVVAGAMVTHVIASRIPNGHGKVSWASTICVGIAVFSIYVIDRLLDNRKLSSNTTLRHRFHAQNEGTLLKVLALLGLLGIVCLFWLPSPMFLIGIGLTLLVGIYLFAVFKTSFSNYFQLLKEPLVACIYTAGIWGTALVALPHTIWENYVLMMLFGSVAFQNLLLFSWFESFEVEEGHSLAIEWGTETVSKMLGWLAIMVVMVAIGVLVFTEHRYCVRAAVVVALMSISLHLLKRQPKKVLINERYRWLGDGVFLLTLWLL